MNGIDILWALLTLLSVILFISGDWLFLSALSYHFPALIISFLPRYAPATKIHTEGFLLSFFPLVIAIS